MTQVANLNSAMNTPVQTKRASKQEASHDLMAEFAGIMNQNTQSFLQMQADDGKRSRVSFDDVASTGTATTAGSKDYEKLSTSGNRRIQQAQSNSSDTDAMSQKLQELSNDVKETLQETMDVSDEELKTAMEELGLEMMDLLQPQNLVLLAQKLSGNSDVSALLTDGNFQVTMQEVTGLIADFQKANGLNATQFSDLLEQLSAQIDEMEEAVKELLGVTEEGVSGQITDVQSQLLEEELTNVQEQSADSMQHTPNGVSSADGQTTEAQVTDTDSKQPAEQMTESFTSVNAKDAVAESTQDSGQEEKQASQDGKSRQSSMMTADHTDAVLEQHADVFRETVTAVNDQVQAAGAETPQIQTYVELQHLMDQMEGLARVFASAEGNTVEMQLNPENLGKLVLTVTEKHGNVTAQIAASNEQVKEALQTQLVELRSTLQNQGIKIEAVEVTVATHEFEQNLDGNSSTNGQMQEQADRQNSGAPTGRRNLDRNNLDELSGLMSEEETLAAQMMRDNGGTVDYTA